MKIFVEEHLNKDNSQKLREAIELTKTPADETTTTHTELILQDELIVISKGDLLIEKS